MKNIDNYRKRFYMLMESEMGDVKPIIPMTKTMSSSTPVQQFRLFDMESHELVDRIFIYEVNKVGENLSFKYSKLNGDSNQSGEFNCETGGVKLFQDDRSYYFSLEGSKYFGDYCSKDDSFN